MCQLGSIWSFLADASPGMSGKYFQRGLAERAGSLLSRQHLQSIAQMQRGLRKHQSPACLGSHPPLPLYISFSGLPTWTEYQLLSREFPGLQHWTGTIEASIVVDRAANMFSAHLAYRWALLDYPLSIIPI